MSKKVVIRNVKGCAIIVVLMGAFVALVFFIMGHVLRANQPYKEVLARAQNDPRVVEALGAPIELGWTVSGRIRTWAGRRSYAHLDIPLRGSKQNGSVYVSATSEDNQPWKYHAMLVTPERGEPIDLLVPGQSPGP